MNFFTKGFIIVFFSILLFRSESCFATHLVGGEITVAYTGTPNNFNLTVTLYRDVSGFGFESAIDVGIYDRVTNTLNQVVTFSSPTYTTLSLGNGCFTPTFNIERAVYVMNNVVIANNPSGYYISYLRCCRNGGITNLSNPGNEGWLAYTEIPDPILGNSSPVFTTFPKAYLCQGWINTETSFQATDANGDVLVYKLVDPLSCSTTGQCGPTGMSGYGTPIPGAQPGPYGIVAWTAGYSAINPLLDPSMAINSSTGVIVCDPPNIGRYVFSVVVEEWRGGVKIGEIRRDFQFQVLNSCTAASISATPGNPTCQGTQTTLAAIGVPAGFTYSWNPSGAVTSSITINPGSPGTYNYTVTATNGAGCTYTATTSQIFNANPVPSVINTGNVCLGQNQTLTASGGTAYSWSNGSGGSTLTAVLAGTYTVWVTNASNCTATSTGTITAPVTASTYTWTGAGSTGANNWFDPLNWSSGCVPTCSKDAYIPNTPALAVSNPPDIGIASGAAACNELFLASGNTLSFSNVNSELDVCGDFNQHGAVQTYGTNGKIKFQGTVPQNLTRSNTSSGSDFHNVILANTASPLATLTVKEGAGYKDLSIDNSGIFTFQTGLLLTEGGKRLEIKNTAAAAITGHGPSAYVFGRIKRNITTGTSYDFPVGNVPVAGNAYPYQLMNVNFSALGGLTDLTVAFENPANATGNGWPVSEISPSGQYASLLDNGGTNTGVGYSGAIGGVWTVLPNSYATTPVYNMTLYGRNYDNSGNYEHSVLKRNTFCNAAWTVDGSYNSYSVAGNVVTVFRNNMTGFSQFAIAKTVVPLPVELLAFDASCENQKTKLSWATASETNNDYFTLERSCDENLFQFEAIKTIPGAGNSTTLRYYSHVDNDDTNGDCYYRLLQTDFNGTVTEYAPVSINCNEDASFSFVGVLPNPADDFIYILFSSQKKETVRVEITDSRGQLVSSSTVMPEIGLNKTEVTLAGLSGGIYFVKLNDGTSSFIKKVIKKD